MMPQPDAGFEPPPLWESIGLALGALTGLGVFAFACWLAQHWNPFA